METVTRTIRSGREYMALHADGTIERESPKVPPSGQWRVVGAVSRNNFGRIVRRYTLADVLTNPGAIPWRWKNGKQRTHLLDNDHGTIREWRSPQHEVF